jgi:hypothetical protein
VVGDQHQGYKYKDPSATNDGVTKIIVKVARQGRARRW